MRTRFVVLATVLGFVAAAAAQTPQPPKPGAEHKRIDYFVGKWNFSGEAKASPMGPAGKTSGTEECSWFAGNFFLVCNSSMTGPLGAVKGQSIMSYDPAEKTYTFYAFNSIGIGFFVRGQVAGKVWTWTFETNMEGKSMKGRFTVTEETPTSYAFKMEASIDGGPMSVVEEGKSTKGK
jgi:Protein of unknown function (DUF1579)